MKGRLKDIFGSLALCSLLVVVSVSCDRDDIYHYKDLCYDHSHIIDLSIKFDWSGCKGKKPDPEQMSVYVYNLDEPFRAPERYDLVGSEGGKIKIQYGNYKLMCLNSDTEAILYRNMTKRETFEAYTRRSSIEEGTRVKSKAVMPKAQSAEDQDVILEPDPLWSGLYDGIHFTVDDKEGEVVVPMVPRTKHITVIFENAPNTQYTSQLGGAITGVSPSVMMESGELGEGCVIVPFVVKGDGDNRLRAEFEIFGHCPYRNEGKINRHLLTLYAVLADNSKWSFTIDVTDRFHEAELRSQDNTVVIVITEELPIPKPITNGGGFHPDVDDWQSEYIDVHM